MSLTDTTDFKSAMQAALWYARRRRRARAFVQGFTSWSAGITVAEGDYVQNINNAYQATNSGTTGATPPTVSGGDQSDGAVTWQFIPTSNFIGQ